MKTPVTIEPLRLNRTPLTTAMKGQPVRIVGYGTTQANGADQGFGQRRQATSPLISFDDNWVNVGTSTANQCFGDSGGPAFMMIDGQEVIVGVDSIGTDSGDTCQKYNGDTRVDEELAFIDPFVLANDPGSISGAGGGPSAGAAGGAGKNGAAGDGGNAGAEGGAANAGASSSGGSLNSAGGSANGVGGSINSAGGSVNGVGGAASHAGGSVNSFAGALNSVAGGNSSSVSGGPSTAGVAGNGSGAVNAAASGNASEGCSCTVVGGAAPARQGSVLVLALGSIWAVRRRRRSSP